MSDISVNIEHLVLEGIRIESGNGQRLGQMAELALQRLLEERGIPPGLAGGHVAAISAPIISLPVSATDGQIAEELALAVYRVLTRMA